MEIANLHFVCWILKRLLILLPMEHILDKRSLLRIQLMDRLSKTEACLMSGTPIAKIFEPSYGMSIKDYMSSIDGRLSQIIDALPELLRTTLRDTSSVT